MPIFGAHMSIAGGLCRAPDEAVRFGCDTFQMFTKSPSQWLGRDIPRSEVLDFRRRVEAADLRFATVHDSYLINLASAHPDRLERSLAAFLHEIRIADALGIHYLVTHPGAAVGSTEPEAIAQIVDSLDRVIRQTPDTKIAILLETTAGQGTTLGWKFEHLADILGGVERPDRFGVCLDTCHVFAAGYDLRTPETYEATFASFDEIVGLDRLKLFHLNDSKKGLGSRVDRHEHLGRGQIGEAAFARIVNDPRFADLPMILETPKSDGDNDEMDFVNLGVLRRLLAS